MIQADLRLRAKAVSEKGEPVRPAEARILCDYARVCFEAVKAERGEVSELGKLNDEQVVAMLTSELTLKGWTLLPPGGME